jgi:chromosome segregation ATPase
MKNLILLLLGVALIGGVFYFAGCGPRMGVIADKAINAIDEALGKLNVKQKDIELKQASLRKDLDGVREKRISLEVRLEQMEKKRKGMETEVEATKAKLAKIQEILNSFTEGQESIERNGTTYTRAEVQKMANSLVATHKSLTGEMAQALNTSVEAMKRSYQVLKDQESAGQDMMGKLDSKIAEIKGKKEAIDALKSTSIVTGDTSIMTKISDLSKQIDDMDVDVETALRLEDEKLKDIVSQTKSVDDLLAEPNDMSSTMSEIDAILKGGQ